VLLSEPEYTANSYQPPGIRGSVLKREQQSSILKHNRGNMLQKTFEAAREKVIHQR
jgi:hypothetical protein